MIASAPQIPTYAQGFARYRGDLADPELREDLLGLWAPCLGPTGAVLMDHSGYANHGTLGNMTLNGAWVAGRYGWALEFDNSDDRVVLPSAVSAALGGWTGATVGILARRTGSGTYDHLFDLTRLTTYSKLFVAFWNNDALYVMARTANEAFQGVSSISTWTDNAWHWVVGIIDLAGHEAHLYVDRKLERKQSRTWANETFESVVGTAQTIGCAASFSHVHTGSIALVGLWGGVKPQIAALTDPLALLWPRRRIRETVPAVGGPYRVAIGQPFLAGAAAGQTFNTGPAAGQIDGRCN